MDSGRHDQSLVLGRSRPGYEDHESGADMRRRRRPSSTSTTRMALSDAISSLASGSQASGHNNGESSIRRENAERKRSTNQSESGDIGSGISGVRDRNNAESSTASDELHTASSNNEGLPRGLGFLGTLATALTLRDGRRTPWPKQQQLARRQPWRVQGSFWNASRRAPDPDIADEQHTSLRAVDPVGTDNVTVRSEGDVSLDPSLNADDVGDIKRSFEIAEKTLDGCLNGFWSDCKTLDNRVQDVETAHSRGIDPPSRAFFPIPDNGAIDGEGQLNILTFSGDSQQRQQQQQQQSCLDPPIINIETVENDTAKQSTRDHDLVTEPSKSIRLALWGLWSGLVRLVGSGLGLALLLASGWFIGLSLDPLHRNSIQQHLIRCHASPRASPRTSPTPSKYDIVVSKSAR
ncbi:hypothetical protein THAOC_12230 [Thalassiosira oceanica]|uniref:Uncharacterized protein n=1 Tax=Thalassiosira oceanica TaxID=159749 RepID=K0SP95_THAOC|nr:hypothetical protein THAOC_12230 [Thalassiosira oceanica]|eukprot:EJK66809.1 hypothetical protein THAOC_12230 [Thalassiosira oceanica]